jgi:hypothetical protein
MSNETDEIQTGSDKTKVEEANQRAMAQLAALPRVANLEPKNGSASSYGISFAAIEKQVQEPDIAIIPATIEEQVREPEIAIISAAIEEQVQERRLQLQKAKNKAMQSAKAAYVQARLDLESSMHSPSMDPWSNGQVVLSQLAFAQDQYHRALVFDQSLADQALVGSCGVWSAPSPQFSSEQLGLVLDEIRMLQHMLKTRQILLSLKDSLKVPLKGSFENTHEMVLSQLQSEFAVISSQKAEGLSRAASDLSIIPEPRKQLLSQFAMGFGNLKIPKGKAELKSNSAVKAKV